MRTTFWTHWVWPILGGKTRAVALPLAIVVGTVLLAVNQGSDLLSGEIDPVMVFRAVANYAIPYVVSSIGYLKAPNGSLPPQGEEVKPG
jgi:hypothetical protein